MSAGENCVEVPKKGEKEKEGEIGAGA